MATRQASPWDGHDRQSQWNFPSKTSPGTVSTTDYEAYGYDANSNRTSLRKRDGQTISYTYDALDRMALKDGPVSDTAYTYNARGLQLSALFVGSGQGVTNTYDGFGRLGSSTTTMGGTSRTLSYQYDADGNRDEAHSSGRQLRQLLSRWAGAHLLYGRQ